MSDPNIEIPPAPKRSDILEWFTYQHLPTGPMQETSKLFYDIAFALEATLPPGAEKAVALRKLLEGKDAAVRAAKGIPK